MKIYSQSQKKEAGKSEHLVFIPMSKKGQMSLIIDKMASFEFLSKLTISFAPIFSHLFLSEMIFPHIIVLLVKAMYQSAVLGLELSQNTVVVITIERYFKVSRY